MKSEICKTSPRVAAFIFSLTQLGNVLGQGTFQNMNFEQANVPVIPAGQFGGSVSSLDAVPGWITYYGTNATTQVLHNNNTFGAVNISIIGPNWNVFPVLQGSYSVFLQSGLVGFDPSTSASIAQTGVIPISALSIQLLAAIQASASDPNQLIVSIGGQNIPLVALSTTPNYTVYGGDISGFSGQTRELRIGSFPSADDPYHYFEIDNILFSNQPIPEPGAGTIFLFGLAALAISKSCRR